MRTELERNENALQSKLRNARMAMRAVEKLIETPTATSLYRAHKWVRQLERELTAAKRLESTVAALKAAEPHTQEGAPA